MSSADEIRAKRLAKLKSASSDLSRSNSFLAATNESASTLLEPTQSSSQLVSLANVSSEASQNTTADNSKIPTPQASRDPLNPSPRAPVITADPASIQKQYQVWVSKQYEAILQVSNNSNDPSFITVSTELLDNEAESVFMEVLNELGWAPARGKLPFQYLMLVYSNAYQSLRFVLPKDQLHRQKTEFLHLLIQYLCSFTVIALQIQEMFIGNDIRATVDYIVSNFDISGAFLSDVIKKIIEQDNLVDTLNIFLPTLSSLLAQINVSNLKYTSYISVFESLVSHKAVAAIFSQIDGFQPPSRDSSGLEFERKTILGALLRLSPVQPEVGEYYFTTSSSTLLSSQISSSKESIRNEIKVISDRLFFVVEKLVRGSSQTRQDLLRWFAEIVNLLHLRTGSHAERNKLCSDGFMLNITLILIRLSSPFLDFPAYSKLDKIDINYFAKSDFLDNSEELRINLSLQDAKDWENQSENSPANFISDCFFLTLAYLNFGIGGITVFHASLKRSVKDLTLRIQSQGTEGPPNFREMASKLLNHRQANLYLIESFFEDRNLQLEVFDFVVGSTQFFTRVIDPTHTYPHGNGVGKEKKQLQLPLFKINNVSELDDQDFLISKTPAPWKYYPEFILEGIITYAIFTVNFMGCPLVHNEDKLTVFVEFLIVLLRCPELVGNPHMKSKLVEILFMGSLPGGGGSNPFMLNIFASDPLVRNNILYALLDFYVMVEKTGASSQFYDKFNSRFYVSTIVEELWKDNFYKTQLNDYSQNNVAFFVRFIARMLNDTTYLLDESLDKLNKIHLYQVEIKAREQNPAAANTEEYGTDEELASKLAESERIASSNTQLSNKTMDLFKLFTKEVPKGFTLSEIVDRLASMLNYNLTAMVGPKSSKLKVRDPTVYHFDPKKTLMALVEIYCNLANESKFVGAVARDGRSFDANVFKTATNILSTRTTISPLIVEKFRDFASRAVKQKQLDDEEELELGEVPDEFLDPLMFTLMENPVILPSSKLSIDMSTIKTHLLSDPTDPFNRVPLKIEDVVEDVELKRKIAEFKEAKKRERLDNMDVEM